MRDWISNSIFWQIKKTKITLDIENIQLTQKFIKETKITLKIEDFQLILKI